MGEDRCADEISGAQSKPGRDGENEVKSIALLAASLLAGAVPAQACQQFLTVPFDFGAATPSDASAVQLRAFAEEALRRLPRIAAVRVTGHSDRTGSRQARRLVALRRAEAVRDLLVSYGLPAALITISGQADRAPWSDTPHTMREPQNRRVEISIAWLPATPTASPGEPVPNC